MKSDHHMNRLLQGDVGSGKTVVAGLAMYAAVTAGYQAALMVPTEILCRAAFWKSREPLSWFEISSPNRVAKAAEKRKVLENHCYGEADVIIGTHALIQDGVDYARLGLIIIDEQQRFGVGKGVFYGKKWKSRCPHDDGNSHTTDLSHHCLWGYGCFYYWPDASWPQTHRYSLDQAWAVAPGLDLVGGWDSERLHKSMLSLLWLKNLKPWILKMPLLYQKS